MSELKWVATSSAKGPRVPQWLLSAAIDEAGTVYIPAAVAGNELNVMLCAAQDGIPMVTDSGHCYLPSVWMATEFPAESDTCKLIERKVREHFA